MAAIDGRYSLWIFIIIKNYAIENEMRVYVRARDELLKKKL